MTGVRWAESNNRRATHGVVGFRGKPKGTQKMADELGAEYALNKNDDVIMNDDNDANRRMVEQCYRTRKTMVNPIVDWTDEDVWDFLNLNGIPHCSLYDEGFTRLGCIGCPLSGSRNMIRDFERWPKYKENYIKAFQRMIDNHPGEIKILDPNADTKFKLFDEEHENSAGGVVRHLGQILLMSEPPLASAKIAGGGLRLDAASIPGMVDHGKLEKCCDSTCKTAIDKTCGGGGGYELGAAMLRRWLKANLC